MKAIFSIIAACGLALLSSCAGGGKPSDDDHLASEALTDRLNRSYGYQVDEKGNWVPRTDKRSQYEAQGESAYFNGNVGKKSFQTQQINKNSWMGGHEVERPTHQLNGAGSSMGGSNRFDGQQASLDRSLQTPSRITGNHLPTPGAHESSNGTIARPEDVQTNVRRRLFQQPDIIDYRQQRELSIQQSKELLGRED